MINYEKHREKIDKILQDTYKMAVDKGTKEIVDCQELKCEDCLFSCRYNENRYCEINRIKWLVSEYKEPEVDWSKVPVDTPVLVSHDGKKWSRRHFSRVVNGIPYIWMYGSTSWTAYNNHNNEMTYRYIKLAEVE